MGVCYGWLIIKTLKHILFYLSDRFLNLSGIVKAGDVKQRIPAIYQGKF